MNFAQCLAGSFTISLQSTRLIRLSWRRCQKIHWACMYMNWLLRSSSRFQLGHCPFLPTEWPSLGTTNHVSQPAHYVDRRCTFCSYVDRLLRCHMHENVSTEVCCSNEATRFCHSGRFFYYVQYVPLFLISFVSVTFVLVTRTTQSAL